MDIEAPSAGGELERYRNILSRRRWWVIVPTVLAVLFALLFRQGAEQIYEATALVRPTDPSQSSVFQDQQSVRSDETDRVIASTIQLIRSPEVTDSVRETLGREQFQKVESVEVTALPETLFVDITTRSANEQLAQRAATVWADTYVAEQVKLDVNALNERRDRLRESATDIDSQIEEINSQLSGIERNLIESEFAIDALESRRAAGEFVQDELVDATVEKTALERQQEFAISDRNSRSAEARFLREEAEKLDIEAAYRAQTGAQVVSRPEGASDVSSSGMVRDLLIFAMIGLLVGIGLALLREYLDPKVKTVRELNEIMPDVPVLGTIPRLGSGTDAHEVVITNQPWFAAEAYRDLRTAVLTQAGADHSALVVSSVGAGAGATTTAVNLATSLAQSGRQVLLIDANLRRPTIHRALGLANETGLGSVLADAAETSEALQRSPRYVPTHLSVITAGAKHQHPAELLQYKMHSVLAWASARFDHVVIDAPPADLFTDASILGLAADGMLVVVRPELTDHSHLVETSDKLKTTGVKIWGAILNGRRGSHWRAKRYADGSSLMASITRRGRRTDTGKADDSDSGPGVPDEAPIEVPPAQGDPRVEQPSSL